MVFSSLDFVFLFLPAILIIYFFNEFFLRIKSAGNIILLIASIVFYSWSSPSLIILLAVTIVINWGGAIITERTGRLMGIIVVSIDVLILFLFKYLNWIIDVLNGLIGVSIPSTGTIILPIGISFYTFQALSYVVDVMRGDVKASKNPIDVALYISFFPQLIAGPIVRYAQIEKQISQRNHTLIGFGNGVIRFMEGFFKKIVLADGMAVIVSKSYSLLNTQELGITFAWLGAIAYSFQILMDFSGYSDMAIGLASMFGFSIPENFNKPYLAVTIRDFWRRWHITLSMWFRDYVYIPLGGSRRFLYRNLAIVWLLTGLWHGANWTFVVWGMVYGLIIMFEQYFRIDEILKHKQGLKAFYRVMTIIVIVLLWVLFRADNLSQAILYYRYMFDFSRIKEGIHLTYMYIWEMKFEVIICVVLSFIVIPDNIRNSGLYQSIKGSVLLILFFVSVSYLVKGNFSPFLYFNF